MEHPFYGSWGYQTTGYFAPTSRYGTPRDLMRLVDHLHQCGIGVILDWVPSHFPTDEFGLARFDGTALYESEHQGLHPDWNTLQFDYARPEVRSFLVSSARHWLDRYHVDGIRVDAVASMLYLDYSRGPGQWTPNVHGGNEDLDAIAFLGELNSEVYRAHPDVQTFAEESTAFPGVSRPVHAGGLGFGAQVGHGLDARHARVPRARSDPPRPPPRRDHVPLGLRVVRALRAAAVARRGRARQGLAAHEDAGRPVAAARQPPAPARDAVRPAGPQAAVHGHRAGPRTRVGPRGRARLVAARPARPRRRDRVAPRPQRRLPPASARSTRATRTPARSSGSSTTTPRSACSRSCAGAPTAHRCSWRSTRPRSSGPITGWACRARGRWTELLNSDAEIYGGSGVGNLGAVTARREDAHGFGHAVDAHGAAARHRVPRAGGRPQPANTVTLGATVDDDGSTHFRVWAPHCASWRSGSGPGRMPPGTSP